ncbi:MAG: tRNA pseudouridine synthase A [Bacteroidia bacterium]|nr:MAG: tRNA pseudouridine synthase A [Bacteroidia bacterium]
MQRYFIQLAYKGTNYHGWQIQDNAPTIQEELNNALSTLLHQNIETIGCGRTDTGVHASEYYAHFDSIEINDLEQLIYKLNKFLSKDIAVYKIFKVKNDANARFDAIERTYNYYITKRKDPFLIDSAYYYYGNLDIIEMNKAAAFLLTYNDFEAFSKSNTQVNNYICKIIYAKWTENNDILNFEITANRFLRNMVRAIVGTLLEVGKGNMNLEDFKKVIESKNRSNAGFSVPAHALFLSKIKYPQSIFNVEG